LYELLEQNTDGTDNLLSVYDYLIGNNIDLPETSNIRGELYTKDSVNYLLQRVNYKYTKEVKGYAKTQEIAEAYNNISRKELDTKSWKDATSYPNPEKYPFEFIYIETRSDYTSISEWIANA
jgi:hypothetical protein